MPQVINTNIMSLLAQQNLNTSQSALNTAMTRLSSGLRINSAQDDPAGYAISQQMTTQVNGLNTAVQNANNGVSLAQTAQGALTQITNNLQNIRELAVESANATNSATDRAALDSQVQQDLQQVQQIATTTAFNGQNLLDGTFGNATFQVGANVGQTVQVSLNSSMQTNAIGQTANYAGGATYSAASNLGTQGTGVTANALTSTGLTIAVGTGAAQAISASVAGSTGLGQTASSAWAKAAAINDSGLTGVTATADTTFQAAFATNATGAYSLSINGTAIETAAAAGTVTGAVLATAINANSATTGVTASFAGGNLTLQNAGGGDIKIAQTATATEGLGAATGTNNTVNTALTFAAGTVTATATGSVQLTSSSSLTLGGGQVADVGYAAKTYALGNSTLANVNVTSVANANAAIQSVDAALSAVNSYAAQLGAVSNRFQSTVSNLQTSSQNITAARSSIMDADFAAETANMTRAQILQQAGTAILAQANTAPQNVLTLLKG